MSIYNCPCCGEKTFNPLTKAMSGQMNSKGRRCTSCGKRCVNGKGATIFNAVFSLIIIISMVTVFLLSDKNEYVRSHEVTLQLSLICSLFLVPRIVNAFCFKMSEAIRLDF